MRTTTSLLLSTLVLVTAACGGTGGDPDRDGEDPRLDPDTVEVTVNWVPRSTTDEYLNGRSLSLSADGIVRQEGRADPTTEAMDAQEWDAFVADLPDALQDIEDEETTCLGAGGTTLTVEGAGALDREIRATVCGGQAPPAADQIDVLVADFR